MKRLFLALMVPFLVFSSENYNGVNDTLRISAIIQTDSTRYTEAFKLSDYLAAMEKIRVVVLADDTSSAGFASDSTQFVYGFQTGSFVLDSGGNTIDTAWDHRIILDTMNVDSAGKDSLGTTNDLGVVTRYWLQRSDTTLVAGYMYQSRYYVPQWDQLARYWVTGLAKNKNASALRLIFDNKYPIYKAYRRQ